MRRAGPLLAVGLAFLTAACAAKVAAPPAAPTADLEAVFRLGLTVVERDGQPVTVVFPGGIDEQTRVAIMSVRDGVDPQDVPETETDKVPAGYFVLEYAAVHGDRAGLGGVLGPIPKPRLGYVLLSCGTGIYIDFRNDGEKWRISDVRYKEC